MASKNIIFEKNLTAAAGMQNLQEAAAGWAFYGHGDGTRVCQLCHAHLLHFVTVRHKSSDVFLVIGEDCYKKLLGLQATGEIIAVNQKELSAPIKKLEGSLSKRFAGLNESFLDWLINFEQTAPALKEAAKVAKALGFAPTVALAKAMVQYYLATRSFELATLIAGKFSPSLLAWAKEQGEIFPETLTLLEYEQVIEPRLASLGPAMKAQIKASEEAETRARMKAHEERQIETREQAMAAWEKHKAQITAGPYNLTVLRTNRYGYGWVGCQHDSQSLHKSITGVYYPHRVEEGMVCATLECDFRTYLVVVNADAFNLKAGKRVIELESYFEKTLPREVQLLPHPTLAGSFVFEQAAFSAWTQEVLELEHPLETLVKKHLFSGKTGAKALLEAAKKKGLSIPQSASLSQFGELYEGLLALYFEREENRKKLRAERKEARSKEQRETLRHLMEQERLGRIERVRLNDPKSEEALAQKAQLLAEGQHFEAAFKLTVSAKGRYQYEAKCGDLILVLEHQEPYSPTKESAIFVKIERFLEGTRIALVRRQAFWDGSWTNRYPMN